MTRSLFAYLLLVVHWMVATAGAQQAPQISSAISARQIGAGQQAVLSYQINGAAGTVESYPQEIDVPGLTISFSGQTQRMALRNGSTFSEIGFRYTVMAREAGEFVIPRQTFKVDGVELSGEAVKLTVGEAPAVDNDLSPNVQLSLGKTEFWKGEVVPVHVAILVHPAVQPLSQFFPQLKTPNFAVNRFDRTAGIGARELNGEVWQAWQMDSVLTALQAGAQELGPVEIKAELLMPLEGSLRDPFGRQQGNRTTRVLTSNTVRVNVKELPEEGKPADFGGAVGEFELEVEASPVQLNAGDPVAVEIMITGTGNFDSLTPPAMEESAGWRIYAPRVSQENRGWGTEPGRKSFTQILIPGKNQTSIPPFVLHYFNPETGAYVTRKSPPVALTITGEFKDSANAGAEARDFATASDAATPGEDLGDILDKPLTHSPGTTWLTTTAGPIPANRFLLHGVPALLVLLLAGAGIRRRWRAAAKARLPQPGAPRELNAILSDLRRGGNSRRGFYRLVHEYLTALPWHLKRPVVPDAGLPGIAAARDRWLYGPDDEASQEPIPDTEQREVLTMLSRL